MQYSDLSSIILEDLHHKRSSEQDVTSMSLFFEIVAYVSSASLLLMVTKRNFLRKDLLPF